MTKLALVAGAGGAASKRLIEVLHADPDWSVIALARSPRPSGDAADRRSVPICSIARLAPARSPAIAASRMSSTRRAPSTARAASRACRTMSRCCATCSTPWSRSRRALRMCTSCRAPSITACISGRSARPRAKTIRAIRRRNFYYDQQDLLAERQRGQRWTWSASRPTFIYDFAPERARNGVSVIGAYAAIVRELGRPLDFPGSAAAFDAHARHDRRDAARARDDIHRDHASVPQSGIQRGQW